MIFKLLLLSVSKVGNSFVVAIENTGTVFQFWDEYLFNKGFTKK